MKRATRQQIPTAMNGWNGMERVIERSSKSKSKPLACSSAVIVTVGGKQYRYHPGMDELTVPGTYKKNAGSIEPSAFEVVEPQSLARLEGR